MKSWIRVGSKNGRSAAVCDVCGAFAYTPTQDHLNAFVRAHSNHQSEAEGWMGAGDMVKAATSKMGIETCTPCEKRRRWLNKHMPKVYRKKR